MKKSFEHTAIWKKDQLTWIIYKRFFYVEEKAEIYEYPLWYVYIRISRSYKGLFTVDKKRMRSQRFSFYVS